MRARSTSLIGLLIGGIVASVLVRIIKGTAAPAEGPEDRPRPVPPGPDDPRWGPDDGRVQIAGKSCAGCNERITVALEGVACDACRKPCHTKCIARHVARDHKATDEGTPYR